jgi:hypothetical protein
VLYFFSGAVIFFKGASRDYFYQVAKLYDYVRTTFFILLIKDCVWIELLVAQEFQDFPLSKTGSKIYARRD